MLFIANSEVDGKAHGLTLPVNPACHQARSLACGRLDRSSASERGGRGYGEGQVTSESDEVLAKYSSSPQKRDRLSGEAGRYSCGFTVNPR